MPAQTTTRNPISARRSGRNSDAHTRDSVYMKEARSLLPALSETIPEIEKASPAAFPVHQTGHAALPGHHMPPVDFSAHNNGAASATTAQRGEVKYVLTEERHRKLMAIIADYIEPDLYADSHVRTLYLDTSDNTLIRRSLEKPLYKEKLRLRTYGTIRNLDDPCFMEIKKKARGTVYKRRVDMTLREAVAFCREGMYPAASLFTLDEDERSKARQVIQEMAWMFSLYGPLRPTFTISYNRKAFKERGTDTLRITFDKDILWARQHDSCIPGIGDKELIPGNICVMEIKAFRSMPLWLVDALNECNIYPKSFSKAGSTFKAWVAGTGR